MMMMMPIIIIIIIIIIIQSLPNAVVEWLTLLLRIREVPWVQISALRLALLAGFSWFSSVPQGECRVGTILLAHDRFLPNILQSIIRTI
jgi:hypothetical protein